MSSLTLPDPAPTRPVDGAMIVAREMLSYVLQVGLPVPAEILDAWPTRDGDLVVLLSGAVPGQWVTPVFQRRGSDDVRFLEWRSELEDTRRQ
jgi:hypothetical protein